MRGLLLVLVASFAAPSWAQAIRPNTTGFLTSSCDLVYLRLDAANDPVTGQLQLDAGLLVNEGTSAAPSLAFTDHPTTGFSDAGDLLAASVAASAKLTLSSTTATFLNLSGGVVFSALTTDVTTGTDEDFTVLPNGTGSTVLGGDYVQIQEIRTSLVAGDCDADAEVGRHTIYSKSAGATISECICEKAASAYAWTPATATGDCT